MSNQTNENPIGLSGPNSNSESQRQWVKLTPAAKKVLLTFVASELESCLDEMNGLDGDQPRRLELWSPRKVANHLDRPVNEVVGLMENGEITVTEVGGQRWIAVENLAEYRAREIWGGDV
jgi:hypothetical protein